MSDPQNTEESQDQQKTQLDSVQVDRADSISPTNPVAPSPKCGAELAAPIPPETVEEVTLQENAADLQRSQARLAKVIQENKRLNQENIELRSKLTETEERFSELLGTLSEFNRNKTTTYVSSGRPQNHLLVHDFIQLKDQDFQFVSTLIFHWIAEQRIDLKLDRKRSIAEIKSVLSDLILMKAMSLITIEQDRAISMIFESVCAVFSDQECELSPMPKELHQALESLIQKGLELIEKIGSADPPGGLWMDQAGTLFDAERHQPLLGYQPSGDIHFTVYPGYRAGNRIFEKACVLTEKDF